ncbi:Ig-like domain-containing protein [Candidatus Gottesmanbacteria bacterium]|nr:Ig-like domain-containing protein [Candidatus Gottesmanbacteria bacterium]
MGRRLIILLVVVVVVFLMGILVTRRRPPQPIPVPTPSSTPTTALLPMSVVSIFPKEGTVELGDTVNAVAIVFDQPIDSATAVVAVTPFTQVTAVVRADNKQRLIILPKDPWKSNTTYTMRVAAGLTSLSGQYALPQDVVITYQTVPPPAPVYPSDEAGF